MAVDTSTSSAEKKRLFFMMEKARTRQEVPFEVFEPEETMNPDRGEEEMDGYKTTWSRDRITYFTITRNTQAQPK